MSTFSSLLALKRAVYSNVRALVKLLLVTDQVSTVGDAVLRAPVGTAAYDAAADGAVVWVRLLESCGNYGSS
jgi:hypothetical protein